MAKTDIDLLSAFNLEPKEIVKYFESKNCKISFDWHEVYEEAHAKAFTVAKMTEADLLKDTHNMLTTAIKEGWSEGKFKKNATELFEKKGWVGKKEVINPKTGELQTVELGTPRRIKKIFHCNMTSAYAVGRYKEQMENVDVAPYLQYVAILDSRTRPEHAAMNGKVFRYDDPIWNTMYPPNGWNCRCLVTQLTKGDVRRKNIKVETSEGKIKKVSEVVGGTEKENTVYTFTKGGNVYHLKPDAGWGTNLGKKYNAILEKQLERKINQTKLKEFQKHISNDISAYNVYRNISKIKDINILSTHYKKYEKIITLRSKEYDKILATYKKYPTTEKYKLTWNYYYKLKKSIKKQDILLGRYIDDVINSINNNSQTTLSFGKISKNFQKEALTLEKDLKKILKNIPANNIDFLETKKTRSYHCNGTVYLFNYKSISLPNKGRLTALHEIMHWLESVDPNVSQKSIKFLEKRTVNDKEERLSKITGNQKYKKNEVAKKDNFFDPYCGRIYKNNNKYYGTEILSMGLQELISNPIEFYKRDKEYFRFVINILKGEI